MIDIVISLCDFTGDICKPWAAAGYICYCVDVNHSIRQPRIAQFPSGGQVIYTWGDVRSWYPPSMERIKIIFATPPCTDMSASGARDFRIKRGYRLSDAIELFDACLLVGEYSRAPYMIENPIGRLNTHRRPFDYRFDPCDYGGYLDPPGDTYTKGTYLWTGNGFVMPPKKYIWPGDGSKIHLTSSRLEKSYERSRTPMGFAKAIFLANGNLIIKQEEIINDPCGTDQGKPVGNS